MFETFQAKVQIEADHESAIRILADHPDARYVEIEAKVDVFARTDMNTDPYSAARQMYHLDENNTEIVEAHFLLFSEVGGYLGRFDHNVSFTISEVEKLKSQAKELVLEQLS